MPEGSFILASWLFGLGLLGMATRRNFLLWIFSAQLVVFSTAISWLAWGRLHVENSGHWMACLLLVLAACQMGVAWPWLRILLKHQAHVDLVEMQELRDAGQPKYVDREIPEDSDPI